MESVFTVLGIVVFLGIGYFFLMILATPYIWFEAYMEEQEESAKQSRASFKDMLEKKKHDGTSNIDLKSLYKPVQKGMLRRFFASQLVVATAEWLVTWGLFLAIEALLAWNLYKGFGFVTDKAFTFLEKVLGI